MTLFIEGNVLIARAHKSFRFIVKFNKNIFFGPNGLLNMKIFSNLSCLQMFNECVVMITRKNWDHLEIESHMLIGGQVLATYTAKA